MARRARGGLPSTRRWRSGLGIALGMCLGFTMEGGRLEARVTSLRSIRRGQHEAQLLHDLLAGRAGTLLPDLALAATACPPGWPEQGRRAEVEIIRHHPTVSPHRRGGSGSPG